MIQISKTDNFSQTQKTSLKTTQTFNHSLFFRKTIKNKTASAYPSNPIHKIIQHPFSRNL